MKMFLGLMSWCRTPSAVRLLQGPRYLHSDAQGFDGGEAAPTVQDPLKGRSIHVLHCLKVHFLVPHANVVRFQHLHNVRRIEQRHSLCVALETADVITVVSEVWTEDPDGDDAVVCLVAGAKDRAMSP